MQTQTWLLLLSCLVAGCSGASLYVSNSGSDSSGTLGTEVDPFLTIGYAVSQADSEDEILLLSGEAFSNGATIEINKNLSLSIFGGSVEAVVSGPTEGIFLVKSGNSLWMSSIILDGEYRSLYCISTESDASLFLTAVTVKQNLGIEGTTAAVLCGEYLIYGVGNCQFTDCSFHSNSGNNGAAILFSLPLKVSRCVFTNNSATDGGGAIATLTGVTDALVEDSSFLFNSANTGGAIYGVFNVSNCLFEHNTAVGNGGAIYGTEFLSNSTFNSNSALQGGAVECDSFTGCSFFNNSAQKKGGAAVSSFVQDSLFVSNYAGDVGGALFSHRSDAFCSGCTFGGNCAGITGAAIAADPPSHDDLFTFTDCEIQGVVAACASADPIFFTCRAEINGVDITPVFGMNIYVSPSGSDLNNGTSAFPVKTILHAVIYAPDGATIFLGAGTYYELESIRIEKTLTIQSTSGINDVVIGMPLQAIGEPSYIIAPVAPAFTLAFVTIDGTGLPTSCLALFTDSATLTSVKIHNCVTVNHQGAAISNDGSNMVVTDCEFSNNNADGNAAVWITNVDSAEFTNCRFINNEGEDGGAIFIRRTILKLTNCSFISNTAEYGGAVFMQSSMLFDVNSVFKSNTASIDGAALYIAAPESSKKLVRDDHDPSANVSGSTFTSNSASNNGGAVSNKGSFIAKNILINKNSAVQGAGIFNEGFLSLTDASITDNTATVGAGLYLDEGTVTIVASNIDSNSASVGGGAYIGGGSVTMNSTSFDGNSNGIGYYIVDSEQKNVVCNDCSGSDAVYVGSAVDPSNATAVTVTTRTSAQSGTTKVTSPSIATSSTSATDRTTKTSDDDFSAAPSPLVGSLMLITLLSLVLFMQ